MTEQSQTPIIERAYELARSGKFVDVQEIRLRLRDEGYAVSEIRDHLEGSAIRAALTEICETHQSAKKGKR